MRWEAVGSLDPSWKGLTTEVALVHGYALINTHVFKDIMCRQNNICSFVIVVLFSLFNRLSTQQPDFFPELLDFAQE